MLLAFFLYVENCRIQFNSMCVDKNMYMCFDIASKENSAMTFHVRKPNLYARCHSYVTCKRIQGVEPQLRVESCRM